MTTNLPCAMRRCFVTCNWRGMKQLLLSGIFWFTALSIQDGIGLEKLESRRIAAETVRSARLTRPDLEIRPQTLSKAQIEKVLEQLEAAKPSMLRRGDIAPKFELALRLTSGQAYLVVAESGHGFLQKNEGPKARFVSRGLHDALAKISRKS